MSAESPRSLSSLDLSSLLDLSEEAARGVVEAAGGTLRCIYEEQAPVTADYRSNRVTVWIDRGRCRRVFAIG